MNPETRYTNRFREFVKKQHIHGLVVKHSDRFNHGIADLTIGLPTGQGPVVFPVEVKYLSCVVKTKRKIPLKDSQEEYLRKWETIKARAYVLVGTKGGTAFYSMSNYDGYIYSEDVMEDRKAWEILLGNSIIDSLESRKLNSVAVHDVATTRQKGS